MDFSSRIRLAFLALALLQTTNPVTAQSLDPQVLQSLQGQLGAGQMSRDSRSASEDRAGGGGEEPVISSGGRLDTQEEQEVRRAQARHQLEDLYVPSPVEEDYRRRLGRTDLRQFGYDFFRGGSSPTGVRTGAIGDDYILGIGDEIQVNFRGATNASDFVRVDRDGRITIAQLPPIQAAGRTLGAIRTEIVEETRRTLLATEAYVTVEGVRSISVFIGGEVHRPGQYNITSMADIGALISRAGGIRRGGSLRNVRLVRAGGGSHSIDLYGLMGIGAPSNIGLRDGDRVIVPVIGPTIAVTGAVPRPAIYELKGGESLGSVITYAGGAIRQRGALPVISRIAPDGTENFIRATGMNDKVIGGDAIQLIGGSAGGASGRVTLLGNVDNPGPRPIAVAGTVSELVGRPEDLRPDTYQVAAVLARRDPNTGAHVFRLLNLAHELRGRSTTSLMSEDRVVILSRADIAFMNSPPVRQIVLGGNNPILECRSLVALAGLVRDTQTLRFSAVTRGKFGGEGLEPVPTPVEKLELGTQLEGRHGRVTRSQQAPRDSAQMCAEIFEEIPDLLPILLEHSISVGGAVRRPGAYPVAESVTAQDMALIAEGLVVGATNLTLDISRVNSSELNEIRADEVETVLAMTQLSAGDDIRFNAQQPLFENSGVLVSGEVLRPGLYTIKRGETLSQLLERAGGLSEWAYAYGAIFTRRSVKQSQEAGFRRTARELNNSLLAVAARSRDSSGAGLAGAATLVQTLAEVEASGRMVVEADPRVLALRPDLDTVLEAGDSIHVPKQPNFVLALGDVNNPGALQFVEGKSAGTYLAEAGGALSTADRKRAFVVLPNGTAQPLASIGSAGRGMAPPPGSTIIVPKNIDPLYKLSVIRDVTTIIAQVATSVATVAVLATR